MNFVSAVAGLAAPTAVDIDMFAPVISPSKHRGWRIVIIRRAANQNERAARLLLGADDETCLEVITVRLRRADEVILRSNAYPADVTNIGADAINIRRGGGGDEARVHCTAFQASARHAEPLMAARMARHRRPSEMAGIQ